MALSDAALDHVAALARLELDGDAREALRADLEGMLGYVARLQRVDVAGVEPMTRPHEAIDVLRDDEVTTTSGRGALERLAPAWSEGRVKVPRTVDDG
jgi:aspartyl-tRNA(Asn)/glutamyl-tRNA(Gln) amidotransferase subunit C